MIPDLSDHFERPSVTPSEVVSIIFAVAVDCTSSSISIFNIRIWSHGSDVALCEGRAEERQLTLLVRRAISRDLALAPPSPSTVPPSSSTY